MYTETDRRVLAVLERALHSASRPTRLRAVAMLARVACASRTRWLAEAGKDRDAAVRQTACIVEAWIEVPAEKPWPVREDVDDRASLTPVFDGDEKLELAARQRWRWEYAIEVWREDGLLVGVYLSTAVEEDDEHAKCVALGQAILASAAPRGDHFDPAHAAAFIVGKRRVRADAETPR